jgi:hypothetical protein
VNAKIDKESLTLLKQTVNIPKENMENYHPVMFTHAKDFSKMNKFEKVDSKTFLYKLIEGFVDIRFGNPWEPPFNRIYGMRNK